MFEVGGNIGRVPRKKMERIFFKLGNVESKRSTRVARGDVKTVVVLVDAHHKVTPPPPLLGSCGQTTTCCWGIYFA